MPLVPEGIEKVACVEGCVGERVLPTCKQSIVRIHVRQIVSMRTSAHASSFAILTSTSKVLFALSVQRTASLLTRSVLRNLSLVKSGVSRHGAQLRVSGTETVTHSATLLPGKTSNGSRSAAADPKHTRPIRIYRRVDFHVRNSQNTQCRGWNLPTS